MILPDEDWDHLDWSKSPAIQEIPVTSAVLSPTPNDFIPAGATSVTVQGYAVSGGGRPIVRVDVSLDGGKTWKDAVMKSADKAQQRYHRAWAWRHWSVRGRGGRSAGVSRRRACRCTDGWLHSDRDAAARGCQGRRQLLRGVQGGGRRVQRAAGYVWANLQHARRAGQRLAPRQRQGRVAPRMVYQPIKRCDANCRIRMAIWMGALLHGAERYHTVQALLTRQRHKLLLLVL